MCSYLYSVHVLILGPRGLSLYLFHSYSGPGPFWSYSSPVLVLVLFVVLFVVLGVLFVFLGVLVLVLVLVLIVVLFLVL